MAKSLLIARKLSKYYWAEAVVCSIYILNRSPTSSVQGKVSEEKWSGSKVNVSHLRIFGCVCFSHVPEEIRNSTDLEPLRETICLDWATDYHLRVVSTITCRQMDA
jgi:hypothetical protein